MKLFANFRNPFKRSVQKRETASPKFKKLVARAEIKPGEEETVGGIEVSNMTAESVWITVEARFEKKARA